MLPNVMEWLEWAIEQVSLGNADKLEMHGFKVYRCGTIVRIDKKCVFKDYK